MLTLTRYDRATFPPETPYHLWRLMREEAATDKVFHAAGPDGGDLIDFVHMLAPAAPAETVTLVAHDGREVAGLFWFADWVRGVRASANVWYRRRYWGDAARQASRDALAWGFAALDVPAIWAYTPWPEAARHAEAVGFSRVTVLPRYTPGGRDLYVLRIEKET